MLTTSLGLRTGSLGISADHEQLCAYKLPVKLGRPVLEQEIQNLNQVLVELIERCALRVCPWESGDVAHVQPCIRATFYDGGVGSHGRFPDVDSTTRAGGMLP